MSLNAEQKYNFNGKFGTGKADWWWVVEFIRMNGQTSQHLQILNHFLLYFDNRTKQQNKIYIKHNRLLVR